MKFFSPLLVRLLPLLVLAGLGSCTVYDKLAHPYRLGTPAMSPYAKAQARAAEKARHKGTTLSALTDVNADGSGPEPTTPGTAAAAPAEKKAVSYSDLSEGTKIKYDKHLLLRKPKLERRRLHHYDTRPLTPREASRENRRLRKHPKGKGKVPADDPRPKTPAADDPTATPAPRPDPTQPAAKPEKPAKVKAEKPAKARVEKPRQEQEEKPAKAKAEKVKPDKKAKKTLLPKPDPTQPQPFKGDQ